MTNWKQPYQTVEIGRSRLLREGKNVAVLSLGETGNWAAKAIERAERECSGLSVTHVDLRFAKPLDTEMLHRIAAEHKYVITVENGVRNGGVGSAIVEFMNDNNYAVRVIRMGIPDEFIEQGTPDELKRLCGFDEESIYVKIKELYNADFNV
jgi:1-deoxy-D-xylulose-5-phosphate synthase